jgi:hypothetical protein
VMWPLRPAHSPFGGNFTRQENRTSLLGSRTGHFYFALTADSMGIEAPTSGMLVGMKKRP